MKPFFFTFLFLVGATCLFGQSKGGTIEQAAAIQKAQPYFIQVAESNNPKEYFPKLYPIGFILKETDANQNKTKYLLGDFSSEVEALDALALVKASGYKDAFIVNIVR